jgi:hypothetical protein
VRRAAKKDINHNDIAAFLEGRGFVVLDLSRLGGGCPDMAVSCTTPNGGKWAALVEVKKPGGKLNPLQIEVRARWQGPYIVAETGPQAYEDLCLAMLGVQ